MIALAQDCLVFKLASGEHMPWSVEMVSEDLMGESARWFDPEFVRHAAGAVFHYFKHELGRQTISVAEFAEALEKVLRGFKLEPEAGTAPARNSVVAESDLCRLARESGLGCELLFFPRLRQELRQQLQARPRVLRFSGLRSCVKQLAGSRRWSLRCQGLEERIVDYLRECLNAEPKPVDFALLVE
jgi:hypothetical protein